MDPHRIAAIGKALAHPARAEMLQLLRQGERCGCEFAPILSLDASVVSRHLAQLSRAGLIVSRRDGVRIMWRLSSPLVLDAISQLESLSPLSEDS
ncbi:helix-turn-helix transcriptional regulator [Candidatus Bipolaricaulota bacterium]|nr:helix-turn-helix transcriptional regulator [Candidatus Bipolaricaulota bacterium]